MIQIEPIQRFVWRTWNTFVWRLRRGAAFATGETSWTVDSCMTLFAPRGAERAREGSSNSKYFKDIRACRR